MGNADSWREASAINQTDAPGSLWQLWIARRENFIVIGALVLLTIFSLAFAWNQPFLLDDYLVRQTALSKSISDVWYLQKTEPLSVDPPLYHFIVFYCLRIFGPTEFATRLPSVAAYTLMAFLLYRLVRRYTDLFTGLLVIALCLLTGAFYYAVEARPYAVVLAADTLAFICWTRLVEGREKRWLSLVGLFFGISIAVGSHWYGFLVLVPLGIAEAIRTLQERRIDTAIWAAFLGGAATVIAYLPLLRAAAEYRASPLKGVQVSDISSSFALIFESCLLPFVLVLIAAVSWRVLSSSNVAEQLDYSMPRPVFACIVAVSLAPFYGFLVGKLVTHTFQPRYVLICMLGLLPLTALTIRDAMSRNAIRMVAALAIIGGCACLVRYRLLAGRPATGDTAAFADASIFSAQADLPIMPSDNDLFLRLEDHGPASLHERFIFAMDASSVRLSHQNTEFVTSKALRRWTRLPITDLSPFLNAHARFYFVQRAGSQSWLISRLLEDHAEMALQGTYAGNPVFLVTLRR